eukprot:711751-Hanusia_phi.AAC.1
MTRTVSATREGPYMPLAAAQWATEAAACQEAQCESRRSASLGDSDHRRTRNTYPSVPPITESSAAGPPRSPARSLAAARARMIGLTVTARRPGRGAARRCTDPTAIGVSHRLSRSSSWGHPISGPARRRRRHPPRGSHGGSVSLSSLRVGPEESLLVTSGVGSRRPGALRAPGTGSRLTVDQQ